MWLRYSIFLFLVAVNFAAPGPKAKLRPTRLTKTDNNVCTTTACHEIASSIISFMDSSVDPCEDFFKYACGNYVKSVTSQLPNYNRFIELDEKNINSLKAIFEEPYSLQDPEMHKKVKDYYASCINTDQIRKEGLQPLRRLLKRFGGWPVIEPLWNEITSESWQNVLYKLWQVGVGYNYILKMDLRVDSQNVSYSPLTLEFPKMTLSSNALVSGPSSDEYNQHFSSVVKIAEAFGANPSQAVNDMQNVLRLERALYQAAHSSRSQNVSSKITVGPAVKIGTKPKATEPTLFSADFIHLPKQEEQMYEVKLRHLKQALPSVKWEMFFKNALQTDSLDNLRIFTNNPDYIARAVTILDGTSKRTVINYFLLRTVLDTQSALIPKEQSERERECVEEIIKQLPLITGNVYLHKIFRNETKEVADDMVGKLRSILKKRISSSTWMDDVTRTAAIDKLLDVTQDVAYPPEAANTTFLENIHQKVNIRNSSYFENWLSTLRSLRQLEMAAFSQSQKASDWYRKASTITLANANYHPVANTIWIPAGVLQGAFFNADRPQSMNFGGAGAMVGHEFTHGFDTDGRLYTKDGIREEWWSAETIRKFDEKAKCLVDQFSAQLVPEINRPLNGERTVGENIADNGGFRQAYEAYLEWMKFNEPEPLLPGLDFNHRQLVWLGNANVWCEKITKEKLEEKVLTNVHSPNKYRVNLGFQNFEEFADDFGCPTAAPMNPAKKCQVW